MNFVEGHLSAILRGTWWLFLLRGLVAIAFGIMSWVQPAASLAALVLVFGAWMLIDGVLGVWAAIAGRGEREHWWLLLLWGLMGIGVGVLTLMAPGVTAVALVFYVAVWAIVTGVLEIVGAIRLRREIEGEWLLGLAGLASVAFGGLLIANPGAGAIVLLWLIATWALVVGVLLVVLAFKARGFVRSRQSAG